MLTMLIALFRLETIASCLSTPNTEDGELTGRVLSGEAARATPIEDWIALVKVEWDFGDFDVILGPAIVEGVEKSGLSRSHSMVEGPRIDYCPTSKWWYLSGIRVRISSAAIYPEA
jgi:hypothetical protein